MSEQTVFPVLETERLRLREIEQGDAEFLYENFSKPEVTQYYGMEPFTDPEQGVRIAESFRNALAEKRGIRFAITLRETGEMIGTAGFNAWNPYHKRTEIGYELNPDHWGKGYVTEVIRAVVDYGFSTGLERIGAIITCDNPASRRAVEKNGFVREGLLRGYLQQGGTARDVYSYSLLLSDTPSR